MSQVERMRAAIDHVTAVGPSFLRGDIDADRMADAMIRAVAGYAEQERVAGGEDGPPDAEARALHHTLSELRVCGTGYLAGRCDADCVARTITQVVHEYGRLREADVAAAIVRGPEAIVAADAEGVIRFWNSGAERVFGFRAEEALGQSLDLIIPERLRARHWAGWDKVMQTGRSRYGETDLLKVPSLRKDGSKISVEFTISIMWGADGKISGIAATLRDVTQQFNEMRELHKKLAAGPGPG